MNLLKNSSKTLLSNQHGQGLTEYIILVFLIAIVSIGVTKSFGKAVKTQIEQAKETINRELVLEDSGRSNRR